VVGGKAPGDPLVEVVVGVDQAGGHEVAGGVDSAYDVLQALGGPARAERLDAVAGEDDVPGGVLGVVSVDGRDRAVLDDDAPVCCHGASLFTECAELERARQDPGSFECRGREEGSPATGAERGNVRGW
jgi:hypothetical protein